MLIKICGITTPEDALAAVAAGADLLGLNFVSGPRRVALSQAEAILGELPPVAGVVGLVRVQGGGNVPAELRAALSEPSRMTHLQLYGDYDLSALRANVNQRLMPVLPVRDRGFSRVAAPWLTGGDAQARPAAIVLDAYDAQREGGTGKAFRWEWLGEARAAGELSHWPPIMLAGGLRPENVAEAIRAVRPDGVDVSSGVEFPDAPGRKDPARMRAFIEAVRSVETEL